MLNASHLLQNEALHYKYHKHISKSNIFKHLSHNVTQKIVCCVLQKLSQRPKNCVWFCRFGVLLLFEVQLSEIVWQVKTLCVSNKKKIIYWCNYFSLITIFFFIYINKQTNKPTLTIQNKYVVICVIFRGVKIAFEKCDCLSANNEFNYLKYQNITP